MAVVFASLGIPVKCVHFNGIKTKTNCKFRPLNQSISTTILTWNAYTDGMVFSVCVFCMRKISSFSKPLCGIDSMDVFDKSLRKTTKILINLENSTFNWFFLSFFFFIKLLTEGFFEKTYNSITFKMPAKPFRWMFLNCLLALNDLEDGGIKVVFVFRLDGSS